MIGAEPQERVIHRLEAFSDIVIGFSLAQVGLSLGFPASGAALLGKPTELFAFVLTFAIVCGMWWAHHRLFTYFFVPSALTIVLNFATLGAVLFAVYSVQLLAHSQFSDRAAATIYACSFAVVFALLGLQYLLGWIARRDKLELELRLLGLRQGLSLSGVALAFGLAAWSIQRYGPQSMSLIGVVALGYAVVLRVIFFTVKKRQQTPAQPAARR